MTECGQDWKIYAFVAFCVEEYKHRHHMEGGKVASLFARNGVMGYLQEHFEILHSLSRDALLLDVETYINNRRGIR